MYVCVIMMTHVMHGPYLFYSHQQELLEHNGALICAMDTVSVTCLRMFVGITTTCVTVMSVGCSS